MLRPDEIAFFHHNGYLIMRGLIYGPELERLQADSARLVADGMAHRGTDHLYRTTFGAESASENLDIYWRSEKMWERDPSYRATIVNPDLVMNIAQCAGHPVYPWNASLVVKIPQRGSAVPWHQDPPYMGPGLTTTHVAPNFTCDIYLDQSDEVNGCVFAMPGHHQSGHVDLSGDQEQYFQHLDAVPLRMAPGDVLFHYLSMPHGSRLNRSTRLRRTLYLHFLSEPAFQQSYNHPHMQWAQAMGGWSQNRRILLERCIADRQALGWRTSEDEARFVWAAGIEPDGYLSDQRRCQLSSTMTSP